MSRWFRVYDDLVNDPKVQQLSPENFRYLINIWCLASKNNGALPSLADISFQLRVTLAKAAKIIATLQDAGLIDAHDSGLSPHNWDSRQFKSDTSNDRVKRFRERQRNGACNVTSTVSETPPETETEAESENASSLCSDAAPAAPNATSLFPSEKTTYTDSRHELWGEGRPILVSLGVKPTLAGQMIGQWVKQADNDCQTVLGAIQRARDERVIDPIPWITRALKPKSKPYQGSKHAERTERGSVLDGLDKLDEAIAGGFTLPPRPL
jgi:hypothetical protein